MDDQRPVTVLNEYGAFHLPPDDPRLAPLYKAEREFNRVFRETAEREDFSVADLRIIGGFFESGIGAECASLIIEKQIRIRKEASLSRLQAKLEELSEDDPRREFIQKKIDRGGW